VSIKPSTGVEYGASILLQDASTEKQNNDKVNLFNSLILIQNYEF
jgi:hypothetical protein